MIFHRVLRSFLHKTFDKDSDFVVIRSFIVLFEDFVDSHVHRLRATVQVKRFWIV